MLRNIFKRKVYSLITILGLAIGLASFILIMMYVLDELSYDRYHSKADRIHRVCMIYDFGGVGENSASQPFPVAFTLKSEFPDMISEVTRVFNFQSKRNLISYEDLHFNEKRFFFADSTFFDIFDHQFVKGDPSTALDEPFSVVITEKAAKKYFAGADPMGKVLKFENNVPLKVTGVIREVPRQSHFVFDFVASMGSVRSIYRAGLPQSWVWNPCWTYILLNENVKAGELENNFPAFVKNYFYDAEKENITLYTQPLTHIHLSSRLDYEIEPNSNKTYVVILIIIAIFILVIAAINFMNLATATSGTRAREIGIRKVSGAYKTQLILQFLGECLFLTLISLIIALLLIEIALPWFRDFTGKEVDLSLLLKPVNLFMLLILVILTGVISGIYPAFYLSSFKPINILRRNPELDIRGGMARKVLVVFQFMISITLIIGTIYIFKQLRYLRNTELGFKKENVLLIPVNRTGIIAKYESFRNEILNHPNIERVTAMDDIIGAAHNTHEFRTREVADTEWRFYPALVVRHDFVKTMEIEIVAGRDYNEENQTDPVKGMLINEAMVKHQGWESNEAALGEKFHSLHGEENVIGVFRDFQPTSLHEGSGPFVLNMKENPGEINYFTNYLVIRLGGGDLNETLKFLEQKWMEFENHRPFDYSMLDEEIAALYKDEENLGMLSLIFTFLILFVAALGVFGLAAFMAEKRVREISIRKVLGASVANIFILLSSEFVKLIVAATLLAWVATYFLLNDIFLPQFTVRTNIEGWLFILGGLGALSIAMMITSYRAIMASRANPAETLKYE